MSLLQTLNSIVEISKIQEGLSVLNNKQFSINELLGTLHVWVDMEVLKKNKSIRVVYLNNMAKGEDIIEADYDKTHNILTNLLLNSINFTQKGKIEIGCDVFGEYFNFYVSDTGCGISEEKQKWLFTDFLNNSVTVTNIGEGSGLGLYLSSGLAKLMGGELWLEKTSGEGTIFRLRLPRKV